MAGSQCNKFRGDKGKVIQTEDLDTYDSDCDHVSNAKAVLVANITNYGSDVISEVPHSETDCNDMENQNRPPMLNKDNYVPWSSRLLRYAKSKPNEKLIYNSIMCGPYVRQMISKPVKQMEADDQAIQIILMSLPEDIYAAVDSCETA
nr:hypothetical protein [Tanacetum cinerariifolium]